jgi:hypothetical protein
VANFRRGARRGREKEAKSATIVPRFGAAPARGPASGARAKKMRKRVADSLPRSGVADPISGELSALFFGILYLDAEILGDLLDILQVLSRAGARGFIAALEFFVFVFKAFDLVEQRFQTHTLLLHAESLIIADTSR